MLRLLALTGYGPHTLLHLINPLLTAHTLSKILINVHSEPTLPSTVPRLESDGSNWPIFNLHFQYAVEEKGFWGHFDGTTTRPSPTDMLSSPTAAQTAWD